MSATTPGDLARMFAVVAATGDALGMAALYEQGGALVGPDGVAVVGRKEIGDALTPMAESRPRVTANITRTVIAGDIAVVYNDWTVKMADPDGGEMEVAGKAVEVCRLQADGTWLFVIDDPTARD